MQWKKVSPELCDILDDVISPFQVEKRKMFGCPAYFVNNNMFCGVHGEGIMLRLSIEDRTEIQMEFPDAVPFEPTPGRVMREYVLVPKSIYRKPGLFEHWLKRGYEFVSSLPPKEKKKKKK